MDPDEELRLVLALSYAAGALARMHAPGRGMTLDDQRFSRELLRLLPYLFRLFDAQPQWYWRGRLAGLLRLRLLELQRNDPRSHRGEL